MNVNFQPIKIEGMTAQVFTDPTPEAVTKMNAFMQKMVESIKTKIEPQILDSIPVNLSIAVGMQNNKPTVLMIAHDNWRLTEADTVIPYAGQYPHKSFNLKPKWLIELILQIGDSITVL